MDACGRRRRKKAEETAKAEAIFNALRDAIRKDEHLAPEEKALLQAQLQSDQDAGKISSATKEWSYKDEDANRQYRYEYTVDNTTISTGDAADDATERKDTVNGTAYVSGSTIIRTGHHEEGPTITSGEVSGISSDFKTLPENVVEDSVEYIKIDGVQYLKNTPCRTAAPTSSPIRPIRNFPTISGLVWAKAMSSPATALPW